MYPELSRFSESIEYNTDSPISKYNALLAHKNNQRNVKVLKETVNNLNANPHNGEEVPPYKRLKYALVAALSNCTNYVNMLPKRSDGLEPFSDLELERVLKSYTLTDLLLNPHLASPHRSSLVHKAINKAIGDIRKLSDSLHLSNGVSEKIYHKTQFLAVQKFYYALWYYNNNLKELSLPSETNGKPVPLKGVREAALRINFNPIKMGWSPAWSAAETAFAIIESEPNLSTLNSTGSYNTLDLLLTLSGAAPKDKNLPLWKRLSELSSTDKKEQFIMRILTPEKKFSEAKQYPEFSNYCNAIEKLYKHL